MKMVVDKLREDRGIGWDKYVVLTRNNKGRLVGKLKNTIQTRNEKDWEEEVDAKSTLKRYRLAKDGTGVKRYKVGTCSGECKVAVQVEDWFIWVVGG